MVSVHFDNIRQQIINALDKASERIIVAVYWFTNEELFDKLIEQIEKGRKVELIIHNDFINNRNTGLNFQQFVDKGGDFYFSDGYNPMHNKFCVIDNQILINGSYNWTYYAESKNRENVLIIEEEKDTIESFISEFERLKSLTEKVTEIRQLTRFEVDENNVLRARDYLANDIVFQAKVTNRPEIVESAFEIAPDNIEVQKTAFALDLTKKYRLKHSIGSSLLNDGYKIVVEKGSMIPVSSTAIVRTSADNQTSSEATIHYGENPKASLNPKFAKMRLDGLPKKPAGKAELKYHFTIDLKGNLKMEKYSLDNGNKQILTKKITGLLEQITEEKEEKTA
ncbi:phospholipase D-like domain-containing protein [Bizionia myxarmorum]|uniref:phospholipase D n=1 Tax=Bizionia myxarmorum TaxID=291186 RepID=A0A5D0R707_9FLAO|nr:phospholipase D-like domain-containing protein [Bizionia myxarmorum]TYB76458.1 Hsp70 family protein [Bizionia myxarmorum]